MRKCAHPSVRRRCALAVAAALFLPAALAYDARLAPPLQPRRAPCAPARALARLAPDGNADRQPAVSARAGLRALVRDRVLQGIEPSSNLLAILVVYFVQGGLGLASLATTLHLKDELGLSAAQVAALGGIFGAPWIFKPLYGFVTDSFLLFGSRRRAYLAAAGLVASGAYGALATGLPSARDTVAAVVVASLAIAVSDVVADAMVVEDARALAGGLRATDAAASPPRERARAGADGADGGGSDAEAALSGTLQSLCWGSRAVGSIASAYASGAAVDALGINAVFALTAALPLSVVLAAACMREGGGDGRTAGADDDAVGEARARVAGAGGDAGARATARASSTSIAAAQLRELRLAVAEPRIWQPALFIFGWLAMPSSDSAFLFFLTDELRLSSEFLGRVQLVGSVCSLAAIVGYQRLLRDVPVARVLVGCTLASAAFGSVQLVLATHANRAAGIPDSWLALGDDALLTALSELAHMPVLVLAARLCPPGVEGALFATLMSVYNAGGTAGRELGAALTDALGVGTAGDFSRLPELLVVCSAAKLLPLPFLGVLDQVGAEPQVEETDGARGAQPVAPAGRGDGAPAAPPDRAASDAASLGADQPSALARAAEPSAERSRAALAAERQARDA
ncbi:hypothetical protein KFE25_007967 [Diacronema lutheri]|uniref:Folate/biopterin transporter n=3 Tax=Diacronema lutheri TaxID=2081491 RepID=A0A8J5XKS6_DIALT|nr:hypothetical protein KFE25_007967 [Diacronema lutheri]